MLSLLRHLFRIMLCCLIDYFYAVHRSAPLFTFLLKCRFVAILCIFLFVASRDLNCSKFFWVEMKNNSDTFLRAHVTLFLDHFHFTSPFLTKWGAREVEHRWNFSTSLVGRFLQTEFILFLNLQLPSVI